MLTISIQFDYSFDTNGFFNSQERRNVLEDVADRFDTVIEDRLDAIVPSGSNSWEAKFHHPATGATAKTSNLRVPRDTLVVYAGGRDIPGDTLALGGRGGYSARGSQAWLDTVKGRGQTGALADPATDVAFWGGSITFDTSTTWSFDSTPTSSEMDFYSVALHEVAHALGFGTAEPFGNLISSNRFEGATSVAEYDGSGTVPLHSDQSHWATSVTDEGDVPLMNPFISRGATRDATPLDYAALADIGWEISGNGGFLSGRVVDASGKGVAGVVIEGMPQEPDGFYLLTPIVDVTDSNGFYSGRVGELGGWDFWARTGSWQNFALYAETEIDIGHRAETWNVSIGGSFSLTEPPTFLASADDTLYVYEISDGSDDRITLRRDSAFVEINVGGLVDTAYLASSSMLRVEGGTGSDELILDFSNGSPLPEAGIVFDGGLGSGDQLVVQGGDFTTVTYDATAPGAGAIVADGEYIGFTGLEPVAIDSDLDDLSVNIADNVSHQVTLSGAAVAGNGFAQLEIDGGLESLVFRRPQQLAVDAMGGSDTIRILLDSGTPIPPQGVSLSGGDDGVDTLILSGQSAGSSVYTPSEPGNSADGAIIIGTSSVQFDGMEYVRHVAPRVTDCTIDALALVEGQDFQLEASFVDPGSLSNHSAVIYWGDGDHSDVSIEAGGRLVPAGHSYRDDGQYKIRIVIEDNDGDVGKHEHTVAVENVAPDVTVDNPNDPVQYSDGIQAITITAEDVVGDTMTIELVTWFTDLDGNTSNLTSAQGLGPLELPDADTIAGELSLTSVMDMGGLAGWTITGIADLEPGEYEIRVTVTDDDTGSTDESIFLTITQEDAILTYNGALFVTTDPTHPDLAEVELRVVVQDISFFAANPIDDWNAGDVTRDDIPTGTVTFTIGSETITVDVMPFDTDPTTGVAVATWTADIGRDLAKIYAVEISVGSYYTGIEQAVITVAKPTGDFITGGGYIQAEEAAYGGTVTVTKETEDGTIADTQDVELNVADKSKINFGYTVKYNKKMTNLQGKFGAIIRADNGERWRIKSNATQSLFVFADEFNSDIMHATFISKANLTNQATGYSAGGLQMIVDITDMGEPGSLEVDPDTLSIALWEGPTLIFATNWSGSATVEQTLDGGNNQIHIDELKVARDQPGIAQAGYTLSNLALEPVVQEAIGIWAESGLEPWQLSLLDRVDIRTANFGGTTLGARFGSTVWIDQDAAGYGWFTGNTLPDPPAGRMDLLSVVSHELGHVLGLEHEDDLAVMAPTLMPGDSTAGRSAATLADIAWATYRGSSLGQRTFDDYFSFRWESDRMLETQYPASLTPAARDGVFETLKGELSNAWLLGSSEINEEDEHEEDARFNILSEARGFLESSDNEFEEEQVDEGMLDGLLGLLIR